MPKSSSFTTAGSRHEDVRGLEVAVNDEGAMRVLDGVTHHAKQAQPRLERKTLSGAPFVDRNAVDQLHDQIRRPVGREAAVEQTGDVGMGQLCEHLSLGAKALDGVGVARARSEDLDGDLLPILAVCALGAIDRYPYRHVRGRSTRRHGPRRLPINGPTSRASNARSTMNRSMARARSGPAAASIASISSRNDHIGATRLGQKPSARLDGLGVRELEELLDPLPVHAVHDPSSSDRVKWLCDWTRDQSSGLADLHVVANLLAQPRTRRRPRSAARI